MNLIVDRLRQLSESAEPTMTLASVRLLSRRGACQGCSVVVIAELNPTERSRPNQSGLASGLALVRASSQNVRGVSEENLKNLFANRV